MMLKNLESMSNSDSLNIQDISICEYKSNFDAFN